MPTGSESGTGISYSVTWKSRTLAILLAALSVNHMSPLHGSLESEVGPDSGVGVGHRKVLELVLAGGKAPDLVGEDFRKPDVAAMVCRHNERAGEPIGDGEFLNAAVAADGAEFAAATLGEPELAFIVNGDAA